MSSLARPVVRPVSVVLVLTVLSTAFACGSSDADDTQASGGASSAGAGAAGRAAAGAGHGGASSPVGGDAGMMGGAAPEAAGEAGTSAAGAELAGQAGQAGQSEPSDQGGQGGSNESPEAGMGGEAGDTSASLSLSGAFTHVHDPDIVKDGDTFYLFSTGEGVQIRTSKDLRYWVGAGQVFAEKPAWISTTDPADPNNLWAPEVSYFGGTFHLYYAASKFGSNQSCIGHATKAALGSTDPWVDLGAAFCSNASESAQDFNAIDPNPFQDEDGNLWLGFGSFWSGLKLVPLDETGVVVGADLYSLSTRPNTAVEAPHLQYHDGFYFLFESVDYCCQGAASTYKIMVGRSADVTGPYVDQDGTLLSDGGGTLVLQGAGRWRGPGHNAIVHDGDRYWNIYHSYDADNDGVPTLRISELTWSDDNWPVSAGP